MSTLTIDGAQDELRVLRYSGFEAMNDAFAFVVLAASASDRINFGDMVGRAVELTLGPGTVETRSVYGIVKSFAHAHGRGGRSHYRIEKLVPDAWRLTLRSDCRIFQGKTAPEVIVAVLNGAGIDAHRLALGGEYATREYCVQYGETDWDFIQRLMEEEGIAFWFEHADDRATMVLADGASAYAPIAGNPSLDFRPSSGPLADADCVTRMHFGEEVRPGKVTFSDYNFTTPTVSLRADAHAATAADLELYSYPGGYGDGGTGKSRATRRLEAYQCTRRRGDGDSPCPFLLPGHTFTLVDTAGEDIRDDLNIEYVLTRVEHRGHEASVEGGAEERSYENRFEVIPADVSYRPVPRTPRPSVRGVQTAVVVGPGGEEIHTDAHGRIKVQFHWDRLGASDEKSSCWVRVRQAWAGPGWGGLTIPRIGQEVVVDFVDGDPDRPLVSGAVYHASNVPPYSLPDEKTKSTLKSSSSIGGAGYNELRFEDLAGSEEIFLHGEKDWNIVIKNDKNQLIGHDETLEVMNNKRVEIHGSRYTTIDKNETITVHQNRVKTVDGNQDETVGGDKSITVGGVHTETIGAHSTIAVAGAATLGVGALYTVGVGAAMTEGVAGNQSSTVGGSWKKTVGASMTLTIAGDRTDTVAGSAKEMVSKKKSVQVADSYEESVAKERTFIVGDKLNIECGKSVITVLKNGDVTISGKDITVKSAGTVKVKGKKLHLESSGAIDLKASGKVVVKGSNVAVN